MIAPDTLLNLLRAAADKRGDKPLYRFLITGEAGGPQEILSAAGLLDDACRIAGGLRSALPASTERPTIVIACWSPLDFARAFFGALAAGATPVPAYPPPLRVMASALDPLKSIIADCKASVLLGEDRSTGAILRVDPTFEQTNGCRLLTVEELLAQNEAGLVLHDQSSPSETAFLQYTSGSTAEARGVIISNENILSNLKSIAAALNPPSDGVGVSWLPWSHDLGLIGNFLLGLYAEIHEFVVMTPLAFIERPARWLQAISQFRAWGTSAPNFAFALCNKMIRKGQVENLDLSCLQSVLCGAEPVDAATLDRFAHRFAPQGFRRDSFRPCYGLAEATLFVSLADARTFSVKAFDSDELSGGILREVQPDAPNRSIVSCGTVQPNLDLAIVDPETLTHVEDGAIGEVWVSGPGVANGYFGWTTEQNGQVFGVPLEGREFLRTGDLGALHQGELFITGRCKDLIIVHGKNYDAHDLERIALAAHPELRGGHVVVFADIEQGERVVVLAETAPGHEESHYQKIARQIRARLGERLGLRPDLVELVPPKSVALTSSGKLRREKVRRRWKQGDIQPLFSSVLSTEIDSELAELDERPLTIEDYDVDLVEKTLLREIKIAARVGEQERLPLTARLSELGVDSLGLVQIATSMAEFLNREVPLSVVDDDPTLSEVLARFRDSSAWDGDQRQISQPAPEVSLPSVVANGNGNGTKPAKELVTQVRDERDQALPELSILFFASADRADETNRYRFVRDATLLADRKGFSAVWVPERHFHPFGGLFPSPSVLSAALSSHTTRIRLRAGSVVLPLNDPVRVAEEWSMVDNLSNGRVDLALATGWDADSFILAPENYERRQDVLFDYARQLDDLWRGERVVRPNGVGVETEIRTYPRPVQPNLNVWITATHRPDLFERAGRAGFNVLTALLMQDVNTLAANIERYRKARREAGFDTPGRVSVMLHTYVGSSNVEARSVVNQPLIEYLKSAIDLWKRESEELKRLPANKVAEVAVKRYIDRSALIGDADEAMAMLQRLRAVSVDEVACLIDFGVAPELALNSLMRLAEAVAAVRAPVQRSSIAQEPPQTVGQSVPDLPPEIDPDLRHTLKESAFEDVFESAHRFKLTETLKQSDMLPFYQPFSDWEGTHARLGDRRILILSALDYLGLATNERVKEAAARAAHKEGTGRSGSRVHSGTTPEILEFEEKLASFLNREDAVICTTGYQAMAGVVTTFMNSRTTLVVDEAVHASIVDGSAIARCRLLRFRHNDYHELDAILNETKSVMVMVEGLYSNDGDISPLPEIREVCTRHGVRLALDDAHGLGVLGATGRGTEEHYACLGASDIIAGTFSKSLASIGGWIAGDHEIIEYVRYHGRTVLFTAALSPPMLAAASTALDILIERPELVQIVGQNSDQVRYDLRRLGVTVTGHHGPVIRIPIGSDRDCVRLSVELLRRGIFVHTVLYPSVPRDEAMIRLCISAEHDPADLRRAAEEFADVYNALKRSNAELESGREYAAALGD